MPRISNQRLEQIFATKILAILIKKKAISKETADKILSWKHSGFSAYTDTLIQRDGENGLTNLAEYVVRSPFSDKKLIPVEDNHKVVYHHKLNPTLGRNFQVFDPLEFLSTLTIHIPAKYKHTVLYFGFYSQAIMGKRKIISFISKSSTIKKILQHLKLWEEPSPNIHSPPSTLKLEADIYHEPFFDDLPYDEQEKLFRAMG